MLALLERNPFPQHPPRYIRAVIYDYHFTDFATRRRTGAWWRRQEKGLYLPPLSLSHQGEQKQGPQLQKPGRRAFDKPSRQVNFERMVAR